ncbi:hypothetical protein SUGI_0192330 [Cryptomeria japonica]|nr:hypothetical protein SUGI_0192330 [Cryptomeria japonica]
MKGSALSGLRGKQVSLTLVALICMTFLVWGWERVPFSNVFPAVDSIPRVVRYGNMHQDNRLGMFFSGSPLETPSGIENSFFTSAGGSPSISAEKSLPIRPFLPDMSGTTEELTSDRSSPKSEKDVLVGVYNPDANTTLHSSSSEEENSAVVGESASIETKVCDYNIGKWVEDSHRPLYSGKMCKRWLSEMWACRLTQRTDFSYEKYRWQPDNCDMPDFEGQEFLKRMQSKTLAFIGDSLGRQQFQSMMCILTGGKDSPDVEDVGKAYGLVRARHAIRPDGWAFRFPKTNTTVLYYWSASICNVEPLNLPDPLTNWAMHLDRPPWFLSQNIHRFDVVVLNTGHHWNRGKLNANRWQMYLNGQPDNGKSMRDIRSAQNFTVHSVVKWLDGQLNKHPNLRAFMRTLSPRHFFNGDWDSGGRCDNTSPLSRANKSPEDRAHDPVSENAVKGTRVELLDITGFSQLRDEAHMSKYMLRAKNGAQDCLHWCLPGVPDTWNELLFAQLFFPLGKNSSVNMIS